MPTSYSDLLRLAKQATGENNNTWGTIANANTFEMIEDGIAGMASLNLAGSGDYTLSTNNGSADEARMPILKCTGLMTAARNVIVPSSTKTYVVHNATTGGYDIVVKTAAGTGVTVAMGVTKTVYCDGTNVNEVSTNTTPADGILFKDCVSLAFADSPYSVTSADNGKILVCDTSGGNIVLNLPTAASVVAPYPFNVGAYKLTSDTNTITFNRSGSDVIGNGSTSLQIARQEGAILVADTDPATDRWIPVGYGATVTTGQQGNQTFSSGTDFTPGSTTTLTLTQTPIAPSSASLNMAFDGVLQHPSEWSYSPSTGVITLGSAIPLGVSKVFCFWQTVSLAVGTPSVGAVVYDSVASGEWTTEADIQNGASDKFVNAEFVVSALQPYNQTNTTSSGSTSDFTSLPSGLQRIVIVINAINLTVGDVLNFRLGTGGVLATTGYTGWVGSFNGANQTGVTAFGSSFIAGSPASASDTFGGVIILHHAGGNLWYSMGGLVRFSGATNNYFPNGYVLLSGELDTISVYPASGAFDGGSINVKGYYI